MRRGLLGAALLLAACDFSTEAAQYRQAYCDKVCRAGAPECAVHCDGGVLDAGSGADAGAPGDGGVDAGLDAGSDAGLDAGLDAGIDAGLDAGVDAGSDAGLDAGVDAGPWVLEISATGAMAMSAIVSTPEGALLAGTGTRLNFPDRTVTADGGSQLAFLARLDATGSVLQVATFPTTATVEFQSLTVAPDGSGLIALGTASSVVPSLPGINLGTGSDLFAVGFRPDLSVAWTHRFAGGAVERVIAALPDDGPSVLVALSFPVGGTSGGGVAVPKGTAIARVFFDGGTAHVRHLAEVDLRGFGLLPGALQLAVGEALLDGGTGGLTGPLPARASFVAVSDGGAFTVTALPTHDGASDLDCTLLAARASGASVGCSVDDEFPVHLAVGALDAGPSTAFALDVSPSGAPRAVTALPNRTGVVSSFLGSLPGGAGEGYVLADLPPLGDDETRYVVPALDGGLSATNHQVSLYRVVAGPAAGWVYLLGAARSGPPTRSLFPGVSLSYDGGYRGFAAKLRLP